MTLIRIDVLHQVHAVAAKMMPRTASSIAIRLRVVLMANVLLKSQHRASFPCHNATGCPRTPHFHLRRFLQPYASCTRLSTLFYVHIVNFSVSIRLALLIFFPQQPLLTRSNLSISTSDAA